MSKTVVLPDTRSVFLVSLRYLQCSAATDSEATEMAGAEPVEIELIQNALLKHILVGTDTAKADLELIG